MEDKDLDSPLEVIQKEKTEPFVPKCFRHPTPIPMKYGTTTDKKGVMERFLTCPRCYVTIRVGPDVKRMMEKGMTEIDKQKYGI